jgi:metal-dependent HD superfamily phosphatase/phosphodiesterase
MRRSIHPYRPAVVIELATVLHDVCHTLHHEHDRPVSADLRNVFAKRIVALFDSGVTDLEQLKAHLLCSKP